MNKGKHSSEEHLLKDFTSFITAHHLFTKKDKILLAVSGGVDSVVMFHLFRLKGYQFHVAHCNFTLRGKHSDKDEKFVRELCEQYAIPFFSKSFDTLSFSEDHGISIQMAARDLRYAWFNQLLKEQNLDYICTAHHLNDSVESVLLNLSRETGINGLTGIKTLTGKLARPLIFATKKQIVSFARLHGFKFRKDKSNDDVKYQRNLVRNKVVPLFEKINPSFLSSFKSSIDHFSEAHKIVEEYISQVEAKIVSEKKAEIHISLDELRKIASPSLFLHHFLLKLGVSSAYSSRVNELLSSQPGKHVDTEGLVILRDRDSLIISRSEQETNNITYIVETDTVVNDHVRLMLNRARLTSLAAVSKNEIIIDPALLIFPLQIRSWQKGDQFVPFGMKGRKKVSDLLVDQKIPRTRKKHVRLLVNGDGNIIWVIGIRADDRFKIKDTNQQALIVKLLNPDYL